MALAECGMPHATVLIVDSHPILGQGLATVLSDVPDLVVIGCATSVDSAEEMAREHRPDVVILDADLGPTKSAMLIERLRAGGDGPAVILLSSDGDADPGEEALRAGATGFVLREASLQDLVAAIRWAHLGDVWISPTLLTSLISEMRTRLGTTEEDQLSELTGRERQVLNLLVEGLALKQIAERLGLSLNTVRTHTRNIQMKLNVHSNVEAVSVALGRGIRPN